ncbi:MAG TPA: glycosyltransferase family 4 protein [Gemmatimonadales bacterium]|nr:glycosyltransferase family 4 protein [Gemmatimonadales bacterium]
MRAVVLSHAYLEPARRGRLRALAGLGCEVTVAVPERWQPSPGIVERVQWEEEAGLRIVPVPVRGSLDDSAETTWSGRALRRILKEARPDILQIEEESWSPVAARAAADGRRLGIPVAARARIVPESLSMAARLRRRGVLRRARGVIAENPIVAAALAEDHPDLACAVIPQVGVTPSLAPAPIRPDGFAIGCVGRLVPSAGVDVLLRACVQLARPWTLVISGTGPSQIELEALAERLGIAARITWLGAQPAEDRAHIWSTFDCLVMPSRAAPERAESLGMPALNAMAHGVPVIVSDVGALAGTVGEGGLVVPEGDPEALAIALDRLAGDLELRRATGQAGRRRAMEEFSNEVLARRTLDFWTAATR